MTIEIRRSTRPVKAGNQSAKNSSGWLDINSKEMEKKPIPAGRQSAHMDHGLPIISTRGVAIASGIPPAILPASTRLSIEVPSVVVPSV
jgi:hypothetical protein